MNGELQKIVIIGGGLAGLACARTLHEAGRQFVIYEAADRIGGRVATDLIDGYRLDRGFQVLLTAYPEARRLLDYAALDLRCYYPGALVRFGGKWHRVADPFRHPIDGISGAFSPIGSFADKLRVGLARVGGFRFADDGLEMTTLQALRAKGFTEAMIERFFRPFLSGVFLENRLDTTVRKLEFVMQNFAKGETAVPAHGMADIPRQLAENLPHASIRLNTRVAAIEGNSVRLEGGEIFPASAIVIATEAGGADRLLGKSEVNTAWNQVTCLQYAAPVAPVNKPILLLNGDGVGPINNLAVPSVVAPEYAPTGAHLVSVSVVDPEAAAAVDLEDRVSRQLSEWFGETTREWQLLKIDRISRAVPAQSLAADKPVRLRAGLYQCGDHCGIASINSALASGTAAARAVLDDTFAEWNNEISEMLEIRRGV